MFRVANFFLFLLLLVFAFLLPTIASGVETQCCHISDCDAAGSMPHWVARGIILTNLWCYYSCEVLNVVDIHKNLQMFACLRLCAYFACFLMPNFASLASANRQIDIINDSRDLAVSLWIKLEHMCI